VFQSTIGSEYSPIFTVVGPARRKFSKLTILSTRSPNAYIAGTGLTIVAGSYFTVENGVSSVSAAVTSSVNVKTFTEVSFRWLSLLSSVPRSASQLIQLLIYPLSTCLAPRWRLNSLAPTLPRQDRSL
jgi:hypothetical protein